MQETVSREAVLAVLRHLLKLVNEVEADIGTAPTAQEALEAAIEDVEKLAGEKN